MKTFQHEMKSMQTRAMLDIFAFIICLGLVEH